MADNSSNSDAIWRRDEIESPCIKICVIHPQSQICTGCYRSLGEISQWSQMSNADRAEILVDLPNRSAGVTRRRGGRAARLAR